MKYDLKKDINQIKEGLNKDGFFLLGGYLSSSKEIIDIKNKIYELVNERRDR